MILNPLCDEVNLVEDENEINRHVSAHIVKSLDSHECFLQHHKTLYNIFLELKY